MKKGFILYKSLYEPIKALDKEQKGELMEAIFEYQLTGEIIEDLNPIVNMAFMFFKNQFDIDNAKYLEKCKKAKESVQKRWNKKDTNVYERIETNTNNTDKREKIEDNSKKIEDIKYGLTPIQKVLEFDESKHIPQLVQGFKKFCDFVLTLEKVSEIKGQITIDNYRNLCDEFGKDKLWNSMQGLEDWLQDPNVPKGKKNKKSVYHLMKNTWLKNGYGT